MKVVIALGSNIGDSRAFLDGAVAQLRDSIDVQRVSSYHLTAPVGGPEQDDYLNAVLIGDTDLAPLELLQVLQGIEAEAGRTREIKWGPRTLDLDLIAYGDSEIFLAELEIPHPRAHERRFVLEPWLEIDPDGVLVGRGPISEILHSL
jgi:2-amino-4-hydroxy-6-hydroxymethyldihydropteridine diphosphokinase